jgi:hypothetical protein
VVEAEKGRGTPLGRELRFAGIDFKRISGSGERDFISNSGDLEERAISDIDIPVLILGIDA